MALGGVALGSVLFFFFPRFSAGYLSRAGIQSTLMSGFTDSVELGEIGEIKKNSAVVMRVKTGNPVGYSMLRWRGIALTTFDGRRWSSSEKIARSRRAFGKWVDLFFYPQARNRKHLAGFAIQSPAPTDGQRRDLRPG